ncbi:MAG: glycoside hydrolase family 15 protein [Steroidobacteraceae bacterium]|nr:glycoside hydrolase family 15 protein [Steroidobacteraceae bacterium]
MSATLDLAVVGNCQVAALVDRMARVVWMCLPRPDGDPVFGALLGGEAAAGAGEFAIELQGARESRQRYVGHSAVLETVIMDGSGGSIRVTDFCPRFSARGRFFRPVSLVRIVEPLSGRPVVRLRLDPRRDYGRAAPERSWGSSHLRFSGGGYTWRVTTDASVQAIVEERAFVLDRGVTMLLGPDEPLEQSVARTGRQFLEDTLGYWQEWVRGLAVPFEWQEPVIRAAITLKLCTYEDTGAVLAALTTSIPEAPSSGRNWDYRYCWLRDAYFVIRALNRLGTTRTMESFLHYIDNVVAQAGEVGLQPLYGLSGETGLTERVAESLDGYRGMGPVRVGNQAYEQVQHDVYGSLVLALTQSFFDSRLVRQGDASLFRRLEPFGERAVALYDTPDAGIWEYRGRKRPHTFSAVMCWAAADRLARIAAALGLEDRAAYWGSRAETMHARILAAAWDPAVGAFTGAFGHPSLDSSCLLLAELGFIEPTDPRFVSTVEVIRRELGEGRLLMRYREEDDFGRPDTAFTVCTFWYINALAAIGRREEARELFEFVLSKRNALGLLSEDLDPASGELWGNFPQTYSMVGIVDCAVRLSRSWEEAL